MSLGHLTGVDPPSSTSITTGTTAIGCVRQGAWGALGTCATYIPVTPLVPHPKETLVPMGASSYSQGVG